MAAKKIKRGVGNTSTTRNSEADLISTLPDDVLTKILSFVSTRASVRTSVLSKRWSRLWISVPNLDLGRCYFADSVCRAQFQHFMDCFLNSSHVMSFHTINLLWETDLEPSCVNAWLSAFGKRDAQKISLTFGENGCDREECECPIYSLPDTFFVQNNLVKLTLNAVALKLPSTVNFPNLNKLHLGSVHLFDEITIENLLGGSPVLRNLSLYLDREDNVETLRIKSSSIREFFFDTGGWLSLGYHIVIDCPNLTYLFLKDVVNSTYNILNAYMVSTAYLYIENQQVLLKILTQISNVQTLSLDVHYDLSDALDASLPMLHKLIHLRVETGDFSSSGCLSRLLHCTPNLVTFCLAVNYGEVVYDWLESNEVPRCFLSSIKNVDIKRVGDGHHTLKMITYILKNAMVLNKLSIHAHPRHLDNETKFLTTLLTLPRSSATCGIEYDLDN